MKKKFIQVIGLISALCFGGFVASCGEDSGDVSEVTISIDNDTLAINETSTITVKADKKVVTSGFTFEVSDTNVIDVDTDGIVIGKAIGTSTVTATYKNVKSNELTITVEDNDPDLKTIAEIIAEGRKLSSGGKSTTEYTFKGVVSNKINKANCYVEDETGGIYIYTGTSSTSLGVNVGDFIKCKCKIQYYGGLVETTGTPTISVLGTQEITPLDKDFKDYTVDDQCRKANIKGLKYVSGSMTVGSSTHDMYYQDPVSGKYLCVTTDKNLDDSIEEAIKAKFDVITSSDTVDFMGANINVTTMDEHTVSGTTYYVSVAVTNASQIVIHEGTKIPVTGVSVTNNEIEVEVGKSVQLEVVIAPDNASNKNVNYVSSNTSAATVSAVGIVTGVELGESTITVTTVDGGFTATCAVSVIAATEGDHTGLSNPFTLKSSSLFAKDNKWLEKSSYADFNGSYDWYGYTVVTNQVMTDSKNNNLKLGKDADNAIFQFQKNAGSLSFAHITGVRKVTLTLLTGYDLAENSLLAVKMNDTTGVVEDLATIEATKVQTAGITTVNKQEVPVYQYTVNISFEDITGSLSISSVGNAGAVYIGSIQITLAD